MMHRQKFHSSTRSGGIHATCPNSGWQKVRGSRQSMSWVDRHADMARETSTTLAAGLYLPPCFTISDNSNSTPRLKRARFRICIAVRSTSRQPRLAPNPTKRTPWRKRPHIRENLSNDSAGTPTRSANISASDWAEQPIMVHRNQEPDAGRGWLPSATRGSPSRPQEAFRPGQPRGVIRRLDRTNHGTQHVFDLMPCRLALASGVWNKAEAPRKFSGESRMLYLEGRVGTTGAAVVEEVQAEPQYLLDSGPGERKPAFLATLVPPVQYGETRRDARSTPALSTRGGRQQNPAPRFFEPRQTRARENKPAATPSGHKARTRRSLSRRRQQVRDKGRERHHTAEMTRRKPRDTGEAYATSHTAKRGTPPVMATPVAKARALPRVARLGEVSSDATGAIEAQVIGSRLHSGLLSRVPLVPRILHSLDRGAFCVHYTFVTSLHLRNFVTPL